MYTIVVKLRVLLVLLLVAMQQGSFINGMQQKQAWKSFRYRGKYFWSLRVGIRRGSRQVQLNGLLGSSSPQPQP